MKGLQVFSCTGAIVLLASAAAAAPAHQKSKAPDAKAQSHEVLYQRCRIEAFRKFGWHDPKYQGKVLLYADFLVEQTDYCVRNGGKF